MIEFKDVAKYYKTKTGVTEGIRNINVKFNLNEFVAITGESGSGKTTLLNVLSGFDSYEDGEILINGNETSHFTVKEWETFRAANIGFVFQNYNIIESYSVYQNIIIALDAQGYDKTKRKERALELIKEVGLETHIHHKTAKLSGGQKQRVVIARALAKDAPIILADEPTGNLDKASGDEIMKLLKKISKNKLVLLVTHNFLEAKPYVTRNLIMEDGNIKDDQLIEKTNILNEKIDLIEELPKNTLVNSFKLAIKNILTTPKRTIFTLSLFLLAMVVFLFFYSTLILSNRVDDYEVSNEIYLLNRNGNDFTKEEFNKLKGLYETKYIKFYIGYPRAEVTVEDSYGYAVASSELLEEITLNSLDEMIAPLRHWYFEDYEIGDQVKIKINDFVKVFTIKDFYDDNYIYLHPEIFYDKEAFKLNEEIFPNGGIKELLVVSYDREEINLLKNKLSDEIRVIDNYLQFEHIAKLQTGIVIVLFWVLLLGIMSVLFLVSYNILKNMMQSRNKDFAVYRSVGVSESEVGLMILLEQLLISLTAFLITVLFLKIFSNVFIGIYKINRLLKFTDYLMIFLVFLIFSLSQGLKFNRRIFNLTVIDSLKEDN